MPKKAEKPNQSSVSSFSALNFAWELGYIIALPLVIFALGGRFLDKYFNSSPLFLIAGLIFSFIISSIAAYRKTLIIYQDMYYQSENNKNNRINSNKVNKE